VRAALLFPGQGAYDPRVVAAFADTFPEVTEVYAEVDRGAQTGGAGLVSPLLLGSSPPTIESPLVDAPDALQLSIFSWASTTSPCHSKSKPRINTALATSYSTPPSSAADNPRPGPLVSKMEVKAGFAGRRPFCVQDRAGLGEDLGSPLRLIPPVVQVGPAVNLDLEP
jgi:hypothetical protein